MSIRVRRICLLAMVGVALTIAGCATQPHAGGPMVPGFLFGILQGFLMPFSFVGSLFMDIRIYAYPNGGWLYDFGYLIGAMMIFGGSGGAAGRR